MSAGMDGRKNVQAWLVSDLADYFDAILRVEGKTKREVFAEVVSRYIAERPERTRELAQALVGEWREERGEAWQPTMHSSQ